MSDDLLQRAARALRTEADAGGDGDEHGRRRLLDRVQADRRSAARRTAVLVPLAAVLITSTAIAAATGKLPAAWQAVRGVFVSAAPIAQPEENSVESRHKRSVAPGHATAESSAMVPPSLPPAEPEPQLPVAAADPEPAAPLVPAPAHRQKTSARPQLPAPRAQAPAESATERPPPPLPPAPPAEIAAPAEVPAPAVVPGPQAIAAPEAPDALALFREAQRLHFRDKAWRSALAAWDAYLREAPQGELAPEARWNRAICLVRLARNAEARRALAPFAQGQDGGYRQAEARALLEAVDAPAR